MVRVTVEFMLRVGVREATVEEVLLRDGEAVTVTRFVAVTREVDVRVQSVELQKLDELVPAPPVPVGMAAPVALVGHHG